MFNTIHNTMLSLGNPPNFVTAYLNRADCHSRNTKKLVDIYEKLIFKHLTTIISPLLVKLSLISLLSSW